MEPFKRKRQEESVVEGSVAKKTKVDIIDQIDAGNHRPVDQQRSHEDHNQIDDDSDGHISSIEFEENGETDADSNSGTYISPWNKLDSCAYHGHKCLT